MDEKPTLFLVDEDRGTREALSDMARMMGLGFEAYRSGRQFLDACRRAPSGCAILELVIPDLSGLELQQTLARQEIPLPVIFLTAHATSSLAVQAMRAGALHFLQKPPRVNELWDAVEEAVRLDRHLRECRVRRREMKRRMESLTPKEREVLQGIRGGKINSQIASELKVTVRAIELRRSRLMRKLQAKSAAQLLYYAAQFE
jgi:two-component system response regulator FixJ